METIKQQILGKLEAIEKEHDVRIALAIESGSRAWGFASPDSDYDCRFVYVRPKDAYVTILDRKDTLDYTPDAVFDFGGWDIRKAILHIVKSNAVIFEWLQSGQTYRKNEAVHARLWHLAQQYFNPVSTAWQYLNMARKTYAQICEGDSAAIKKYFYVLRPLACARFICTHNTIPFMEYQRNLSAITVPEDIRAQIDELLGQKAQAKERFALLPRECMLAYFGDEMTQLEAWLCRQHKQEKIPTAQADACFREVIAMVNANDGDEEKDSREGV